MSWEDILSKRDKPDEWISEEELTRYRNYLNSLSEPQPDKDECCENAFESTKIWFEQNNFTLQDQKTKEEHGIEMFEDCDSLRHFLSNAKTFMDSPEGNELQQILEEWKRCESTSVGNWRKKLA